MRNILFAFLCFFLFWGGICTILFNIKIGLIAGVGAGVLGIFYYLMLIKARKLKSKEER